MTLHLGNHSVANPVCLMLEQTRAVSEDLDVLAGGLCQSPGSLCFHTPPAAHS